MRIKQIELNGFKSFMERTIVGPNGCGKSNIVDAIRWVLGEQSPRHLRGEAMEDVIFTGNTENGPLGMAEVGLLLERDEADFARGGEAGADDEAAADGLPPELATASEILVSRRYFRSGESEYAINRAPCRLKDITELFLGTGVGTKAYAIIEQGRVDQLINAKPEELRLFIEEAAGTTRFRSRKVAAERKMERTRENLLRVQDIVRELERQMASLERQARRAEEYHRIKQELRELDLRVMAVRQRSCSAEVAALGERLAALQAAEAASAEAIRQKRGALDEAHAARATNEERLRAVEEELTAERLAAAEAQARSHGLAERPCLGLGGGEAFGRQLLLHRAQPLLVGRASGVGLVEGAAPLADGLRRGGLLRLEGRQALAQGRDLGRAAPLADRHHAQVELAQLLLDAMVLLGAPRLALERGHLPLELAQDVLHAEQVLARALHLPLRGHLAAAKARRAGRLLDEQAQLLRLGVDQLIHAPLLDDGIGLRADPGAEEELGDVLQAAGRAVDRVLGLARAEVAPAHQDLARRGELGREAVGGGLVVRAGLAAAREVRLVPLEEEPHLGHAERPVLRVAGEDDVLHRLAAEMARALLAQHPADRVDRSEEHTSELQSRELISYA